MLLHICYQTDNIIFVNILTILSVCFRFVFLLWYCFIIVLVYALTLDVLFTGYFPTAVPSLCHLYWPESLPLTQCYRQIFECKPMPGRVKGPETQSHVRMVWLPPVFFCCSLFMYACTYVSMYVHMHIDIRNNCILEKTTSHNTDDKIIYIALAEFVAWVKISAWQTFFKWGFHLWSKTQREKLLPESFATQLPRNSVILV